MPQHHPPWKIAATAPRRSQRVSFAGGNGHALAGIVDAPESLDVQLAGDSPPAATGPHDSDAARPPVVLFSHCFTCNKDLKAIVRISRQLAARGAVVLRYDMTGLGGSEGKFAETNFETNLADLIAAARFARQTIGAPTILFGHSLGGAASLAAAAEWPDDLPPLRGVATLAAPSDTRHLAELLVRMDGRVETEGRGVVTIGGQQWETTPQLIENLRRYDLPARIARIRIPLMLFHSPVDATVGYEQALRIMSLVTSAPAHSPRDEAAEPPPAVSLITLAGADHLLVTHQADIELVADATAVWLQRLLS